MDLRNNTIAGWVLGSAIAALGLSIVGSMLYESHPPAKPGYPVEGVADDSAGGAAVEVPIATLLPTADPAKGAEVFKKCAACHTITQGGANQIGPNLYKTLGDAIGKGKGGFAFSDALAKVGGNWDFDKMNAWLTSPRKFAPGTKMTFAGLSDPKDRANVLVYINQQGSNLPLPAAPAAKPGDAKTASGTAPGGAAGGAGAGAAPGAKSATDAVAKDVRGSTADIGNTGTAAMGAPSVDPKAQKQGALAPK